MDGHGVDRTERWASGEYDGGPSPRDHAFPDRPAMVEPAHRETHDPWTNDATSTRGDVSFEVARYDPDRFLQGLVATAWRQAAARRKAVYVQGPWPTIALYPSSFAAVVDGGSDSLRAHAGRDDLAEHANLVFTPAPLYDVNHPDMVPLDILLWKLALGASRGRLPLRTALDTPCALRDWPNFTRLIVTPGAMSIAALWAQQTCTLSETIRLLNLPPADVFAFYSAAAAIDLVRPEPATHVGPNTRPTGPPAAPARSTPPPSSPPPTIAPASRRSLLRKVFDKLRTS